MADKSAIEWCDATWNPVRGCSKVSEGCRNCYAMGVAARFSGPGLAYEGLAMHTPAGPQWTNKVSLVEDVLTQPMRWTRPRKIFVNSMSDLFHKDVPFEYIDRVFAVMALSTRHTFQVLTKRPERMSEYMNRLTPPSPTAENLWQRWEHVHRAMFDLMAETGKRSGYWNHWPLPNVWLGTSVEDQKAADERIPHLMEVPAAVRFLSCEPLLGPVDLSEWLLTPCTDCEGQGRGRNPNPLDDGAWICEPCGGFGTVVDNAGIHWVIAGGESGSQARPANPDWFRSLRDQCQTAGVPYLFKQWGEFGRVADIPLDIKLRTDLPEHVFDRAPGSDPPYAPVYRVGKKIAGRLLDGRTWDEFPVYDPVKGGPESMK